MLVSVSCSESLQLTDSVSHSEGTDRVKNSIKILTMGLVQWLRPIISALWEAEVGGLLGFGSLRPPWETW